MFRHVKLKNYKSLIDIDVNLCSKKDSPKNMIVVYGENGIGKSNFVSSFYTLYRTLMTKSFKETFEDFFNSEDNSKNKDGFNEMHFNTLERLITDCKTLGSTENMVLEFGFTLKGKKGTYRLETDDANIVYEKLEYVSNKNQTKFFELSAQKTYLNESIFQKADYEQELHDLSEKYWGKHSLLALLVSEILDKRENYVGKRISKPFMDVIEYFLELAVSVKNKTTNVDEINTKNTSHKILANLAAGDVSITDENELNKYEEMLNDFFTNLYSDIKQVYYAKSIKNNEIHYQLFVKKLIHDIILDIHFGLESTGTQQLLHIFPFLLSSIEGETVVIDEMDTGIHDVLVTNLLENLDESITGQLIITTHNTMLLESEINKDSIYIFTADQDAKKELVPLSSFEGRIHPNLNIRKRYLEGMYGGVPMSMDVDFDSLAQILK